MKTRAWISAMRFRTLPLALSSIGMGSFLALSNNVFQLKVMLWAGLTTILLQVLSNLANDYGDSINGADNETRIGPTRAVQSGIISAAAMKQAIYLFIILSLTSGIVLLSVSVGLATEEFYWFLGFGVLSIAAAYLYTAGSRPYGYAGLGDIMVLVFFGILGVMGSYFLYAQEINFKILLPAISVGALATGVLNINNIRDTDSDAKAGKHTIPVRFGHKAAIIYHWTLLLTAILSAGIYIYLVGLNSYSPLLLLGLPLLLLNGYRVSKVENNRDLDPYLKQLAMSSLLFMFSFGMAIVL